MTQDDVALVLDRDPYVTNHPHARPFWQAAASGIFLLPRCRSCGRAHWYPRAFCPFCHSTDVAWEPASGGGSVYACTALRRGAAAIVAYVRLDEGPVVLTNLVDCVLEDVRIEDRVTATFRPSKEGRMVPVFTLAPRDTAARP